MTIRVLALLVLPVAISACGGGGTRPIAVRAGVDACHRCRMIVSDSLAAQIVAPGEEPLIFDDFGCLRDHLAAASRARTTVYVVDHRTGEWVSANDAVYTYVRILSTPMSSGLVAHADVASRDQDVHARGGELITAEAALGGVSRRETPP